jgi:hypothetical protein
MAKKKSIYIPLVQTAQSSNPIGMMQSNDVYARAITIVKGEKQQIEFHSR